jgi:hypothetical protein
MNHQHGPPRLEVGPRPGHHPRTGDTDTNITSHAKADTKQSRRYDRPASNARRRVHAMRSTPVGHCGCIRDPEVDRHRCGGDEITDVMAEAAVSAVVHLDQLGTPALLDTDTCRAIWRIGHHKLSVAVHRRTGAP